MCVETGGFGGASPFHGFHSILPAFCTVYKVAMRAGMGTLIKGAYETRFGWLAYVYFPLIMIFISLTALALFIAIVRTTFGKTRKRGIARAAKAKERKARRLISSMLSGSAAVAKASEVAEAKAAMVAKVARKGSAAPALGNVLWVLPPYSPPVRFCAWIIGLGAFDTFITLCIAANCIFLGMDYYEENAADFESWDSMLGIAEMFFTVVFAAEMCLKIVGLQVAAAARCGCLRAHARLRPKPA